MKKAKPTIHGNISSHSKKLNRCDKDLSFGDKNQGFNLLKSKKEEINLKNPRKNRIISHQEGSLP